MAKDYGVAANLKSSMLIDGIIYADMEFNGSDLSTRTYDCVAYMESMEAVRLLMKKSGANCILDCAKKVKAELSAALTAAGEPGVRRMASWQSMSRRIFRATQMARLSLSRRTRRCRLPSLRVASAVVYAPLFVFVWLQASCG